MSEYIKREEAISQLESLWDKIHDGDCLIDPDCELGINESIEVIKAIPAADVVKVRHGKWKGDFYECSVCGFELGWSSTYCPCCGARMDGERDD